MSIASLNITVIVKVPAPVSASVITGSFAVTLGDGRIGGVDAELGLRGVVLLGVAVGVLRAGDVNRHAVADHVGVGNVIGRGVGRIAGAPDCRRPGPACWQRPAQRSASGDAGVHRLAERHGHAEVVGAVVSVA